MTKKDSVMRKTSSKINMSAASLAPIDSDKLGTSLFDSDSFHVNTARDMTYVRRRDSL